MLTRIPRGANSTARLRVRLVTAAFIAAYTAKFGAARWASMEVTLMMLAPAAAAVGVICSTARWVDSSSHEKLERLQGVWERVKDLPPSSATRPTRNWVTGELPLHPKPRTQLHLSSP